GPVMIAAFDKDWKPLAAADVIVHDVSGAVASSSTTNAAGIATVEVPFAGAVTVANRVADTEYLTTITGVQPFDVLTTINLDTARYLGPQVGTLTVGLAGPFAGAEAYGVATSCQSSLGTVSDPSETKSGTVYRDCVDDSTMVHVIEAATMEAATRNQTLAFSIGSATLAS